jgi:peptidyl-prolyl cis-trans isomerase D
MTNHWEATMLEGLRKKRNSLIVLLVFAAIIVVFVFWGVGPGGNGDSRAYVAKVDGVKVPAAEYEDLYRRELEYYKGSFKGQFTDEMAAKLNLRQRALDTLINRAVILNEAKGRGIKIKDDDVQKAIQSIPAFLKDGAFDKETYFKLLSANRLKPADFEKGVREDLAASKLRDAVIKDVAVADDEVRQAYLKEFRQIDLDFAAFDPARFKARMKVTDEEGREYLGRMGQSFMVPAKVRLFYAVAHFKPYADRVSVTPEEVNEFYAKNKSQFETPPRIRARHILIRPDAKAADQAAAKASARRKAEDALARAQKGDDFSALARALSEDPGSAAEGGDLGWFQRGVMVKQFEDAAFALKKGETSGIVETEYGFHIIRVDDAAEGGVMPLDAVESSIRANLKRQKSRDMAGAAISTLEKAFREATTEEGLRKAASAHKEVTAATTGLIAEDDPKSEFTRMPNFKKVVFTLGQGGVDIIEMPGGINLVKILERVEPRVPDYASIAGKVKEMAAKEKTGAEAAKKAKETLEGLLSGADFAKTAKKEGLAVGQTGYFSRAQGFIPKVGAFAANMEKLYEVSEKAPYYPEVFTHNSVSYIFRFRGAREADESALLAQKENIRSRLLSLKHNKTLDEWLKGLRGKAKIEVYEEKL